MSTWSKRDIKKRAVRFWCRCFKIKLLKCVCLVSWWGGWRICFGQWREMTFKRERRCISTEGTKVMKCTAALFLSSWHVQCIMEFHEICLTTVRFKHCMLTYINSIKPQQQQCWTVWEWMTECVSNPWYLKTILNIYSFTLFHLLHIYGQHVLLWQLMWQKN